MFFELRSIGGEAGVGVGIREDFLSRIKIQYMFSVGKGYINYLKKDVFRYLVKESN